MSECGDRRKNERLVKMRKQQIATWLLILLVVAGCLTPTPTPSPIPTPTVSSPLATPERSLVATPVPIARRSKVSVHTGNRPEGLDGFLEVAFPTVVYSLNNGLYAEIVDHSPHTLLVRRVQNSVWGRLPDGMYNGLLSDNWEAVARASARHEALEKTINVPVLVTPIFTVNVALNFMQFVKLTRQDYVAPMNEPVLGSATGDYALKARWLDAWFQEWLTIAHQNGIKGSIYSFPTGEPPVEAVPYLVGSARMAAQFGDIIDVHEYGINGGMMSGGESGAFRFVQFYNALPPDARPKFVISEFSSGNGYDTGLHGVAWISDAVAYGLRLRQYPYLIGAAAFQLDLGAESNIPPDVLEQYALAASRINWSFTYRVYLPLVR